MAWRVAESLDVLLEQINKLSPNRSKASDGSIGDPRHQAEASSDHNPHVVYKGVGVVTARDFTNDPDHGIDSEKLANALLASKDPRIKYIISNKKIASGTGQGHPAWAWRPYTGANPHNHHCHISVKPDPKLFDDTAPWKFDLDVAAPAAAAPALKDVRPVLRKGDKDKDGKGPVRDLQTKLNDKGAKVKVDGDFGQKTDEAVVAFQKATGLVADGVAGSYTWKALDNG